MVARIEVSKVVENLPQSNSDPAFVQFAVNRLAAIYGVLFLVWRRIHGDLGPLDWLVFQTTNAELSTELAANERGAIDDAVDAVISQLKPYSLEKSVVAVLNRVRAAVEKNIVVVVDEAQALVVIGTRWWGKTCPVRHCRRGCSSFVHSTRCGGSPARASPCAMQK
jgi:hypothetical protein